jgi:hypothetical protein
MRAVSAGAVSIGSATLLTTLIEELRASGALSNEAVDRAFSTAVSRLQGSSELVAQREAIDFLEMIASSMKPAP